MENIDYVLECHGISKAQKHIDFVLGSDVYIVKRITNVQVFGKDPKMRLFKYISRLTLLSILLLKYVSPK